MKKKILFSKISRGFSLVESVVALALLSGVIVLFGYFSSTRMSQINSSHIKMCNQTAQDVMDRIKSVGIIKSVNQLNVTANTMTRPSGGEEDRLNFIRISDDWLNTNSELWTTSGGSLILKNHKALIGSMSLLNSLYNSDSNYCSNATGLEYSNPANASLIDNKDVGHLRNVRTSIRIQALNLNTGDVSCPNLPIVVRPAGLDLSQTQAQLLLANQIRPEPGSRADLGFYVTVNTSYIDNKNNPFDCNISAAFNYPKISSDDVDDIALIAGDIDADPIALCNSSRDATARIQVSPNLKNEKAITLVCRDASIYMGGTPPAPAECIGGGQRTVFPNPSGRWVNCNTVTLCGQPPNNPGGAESNPGLGASDGYLLRYTGISLGCNMAIEVKALDAAHNLTLNSYLLSEPQPPANTLDCSPCTAGFTNRAPSIGWCPGSGRTMATQCDPSPPPNPGGGDGDGGGDGGDSGGHHDGSDGDDGANN